MVQVKKAGISFWKKTIVEHERGTTVFNGSAKVEVKNGTTCVTENGLFSSAKTCYVEPETADGCGARPSLPDGDLVGRSKSIELVAADGSTKRYDSKLLTINRLVKQGDEVRVISKGVFGEKVIAQMPSRDLRAINSEDCGVCGQLNPLYANK